MPPATSASGALDTTGTLHLLAREGSPDRQQAREAVHRDQERQRLHPDQTRSFNTNGQIIYRATFTDGTSAIVRVTVP